MELYENNFNLWHWKSQKWAQTYAMHLVFEMYICYKHTLALGMRLFLSTLSQKLKMHNVPELWHCHTLYICSSSVFFRLSLSNFDGLTSSALSIWRTRAWWCKSVVLALLVTIHHMKYSWDPALSCDFMFHCMVPTSHHHPLDQILDLLPDHLLQGPRWHFELGGAAIDIEFEFFKNKISTY